MKSRPRDWFRAHKKTVLCLGVILGLGLVPLLWFKGGLLIVGFDFVFPLNPSDNLVRHSFVWDDRVFAGWDGAQFIPYVFPYGSLVALLQWVGLSLASIEKILFVSVFVLPGLSMYYLASSLAGNDRRHVTGLVSALVYMFNPYTMIQWHDGHQGPLVAYAIMPLLLGLYIGGLSKERSATKDGILIGLASVVIASVASNPAAWIVAFVPLAIYFVYYLGLNRKWGALRQSLCFSLSSLLWVGLLNFWWMLPLTNQFVHSAVRSSVAQDAFDLVSASSFSSFLELFRLLGYWGWYQGYGGEPYFSFAHKYSSGFLLALGLLISALAFACLLFRPRSKHVLFFALLVLTGLFLAKGTHSPLGGIYEWLYRDFPGFWVFRSSWNRFFLLVALGLAFLLGTTSCEIYHRLKGSGLVGGGAIHLRRGILAKGLLLSVVILVAGYSWPLFTGEVIEEERETLAGQYASVPDYWSEGAEWINQQDGEFRVLVLPDQGYVKYEWGYAGTDITPDLITKPQIVGIPGSKGPGDTAVLTQSVYDSIHENSERVAKALAVMDVKYILQRNDVDWAFYGGDSPEYMESVLSSQDGIHSERTFGELDFYRIEYWLPLGLYASSNAILLDGGFDDMFEAVNSDSFIVGESALFLSEQISPNQAQLAREYSATSSNPPVAMSFTKVNPTRYEIKVTGASEPFFLVLSESYHSQWKAFVNSKGGSTNWMEAFIQKSIPGDRHSVVNGYANAWYVDPAEMGVGEEFSVTLYYQPQSLLYLGWIVSGMAFVGSIGLLVWGLRRARGLEARC